MLLIYPERRRITESKVIDWAFDILCNDAILEHQLSGCTCEESHLLNLERPTLQEAKDLLEDRGVATFEREDGDQHG